MPRWSRSASRRRPPINMRDNHAGTVTIRKGDQEWIVADDLDCLRALREVAKDLGIEILDPTESETTVAKQERNMDAYDKLTKKARKLAAREGISQAAAFEKVYTDPANHELVVAEKTQHVAKAMQPQSAQAPTSSYQILMREREDIIRKARENVTGRSVNDTKPLGDLGRRAIRRLVESIADGLQMSGQCRTRPLAMAQAKYQVEQQYGAAADSIRAAFSGRDGEKGSAGRGSVMVG